MNTLHSLTYTHKDIASEFHPTKNSISPNEVSYGSSKKIIWIGKICKHEWEARIFQRTMSKQGCPFCAGVKVLAGFNDFASLVPMMLHMWHPTKNNFSPYEVTAQSSKKAWFLCPLGHEWETAVYNSIKSLRRGHTPGCPVCSNQKLLVGYNDLATTNPLLAKQWHPTKNGSLSPQDVMSGSGKIVWWMCSNNHEWKAQINSRSRNSCSKCSKAGTSKIEEAFILQLEKQGVLLKAASEKIFANKNAVKFDGVGYYISKSQKIIFEYDGQHWHQDILVMEKDNAKTKRLLELGYVVIRVREISLGKIQLPFLDIDHPNLLQLSHSYDAKYSNVLKDTDKIINWLERSLNV